MCAKVFSLFFFLTGSNTAAFAGYKGCTCMEDFYRMDRFSNCNSCRTLLKGLKCENDLASLESGYWWNWVNKTNELVYEKFATNLLNVIYRPGKSIKSAITYSTENAFPYKLPKIHKCEREKSCTGGIHSSCEPGYQGPMCEICIDGYYKKLKRCMRCPTKTSIIVQLSILAAVVAIITAALVWIRTMKSKKRDERSSADMIFGTLKIAIGCYQVTYGVMESFSYVTWPDYVELIAEYSEFLQLRFFQIAPIYCLMPNYKMDAFGSLFAILALNAAAILLSALVYVLSKLCLLLSTLSKEQKEKKASRTKALIYRNLFFFLYVTYLSTCSMTARVFPSTCRRVCLDEEEKTCSIYLKADYTIKCEGQEYYNLVIVAYCAIPYIVFLPIASLIVVWRNRKFLNRNAISDEKEALRPQDQGTEIITGLRFLVENYNSASWYWEFFEICRKFVLTFGTILVGGYRRVYVGLVAVVSALYGTAFATYRPMKNQFEYTLMTLSLSVTFTNLGIGTISKIPEEKAPASLYAYMDSIWYQLTMFIVNASVVGYIMGNY